MKSKSKELMKALMNWNKIINREKEIAKRKFKISSKHYNKKGFQCKKSINKKFLRAYKKQS